MSDVKSSVDRPLKELKGFKKVFLQAGESKKVDIKVDWKALAFWDEKLHQWKAESGDFIIQAGTSSQDIKQKITIFY